MFHVQRAGMIPSQTRGLRRSGIQHTGLEPLLAKAFT